jgi:hypothetical protein
LLLVLLVQGVLAGLYFGRYLGGANPAAAALGPAIGMALAQTTVVTLVWLGPYLWFCLRSADLKPRAVLLVLWPAARGALLMGLAVGGLRYLLVLTDGPEVHPAVPPALRLVLLVSLGVLVYSLVAWCEVHWAIAELTVAPTGGMKGSGVNCADGGSNG